MFGSRANIVSEGRWNQCEWMITVPNAVDLYRMLSFTDYNKESIEGKGQIVKYQSLRNASIN